MIGLKNKYARFVVILSDSKSVNSEVLPAINKFCSYAKCSLIVGENIESIELTAGSAFLVIDEPDIAFLVKVAIAARYELGKDIGILSLNDSMLKKVMEITVLSSDFLEMGKIAASMVLNNKISKIENNKKMITRSSL